MSRHLYCFGLGYVARALGRVLAAEGWTVGGTVRGPAEPESGIAQAPFEAPPPAGATHLLLSAPPDEAGDPVLARHGAALAGLRHLAWIGYLSTTGVYGDRRGGWVDEETPPAPGSPRGRRRVEAEDAWLAFGRSRGVPVQVFRLAGIYGPGRSALDAVRAGRASRIVKPGQVFGRIHVDDIVATLRASMARPNAGAVYNLADDEPAPPQDVILEACRLLDVAPPPEVPFADARLSPMAASFYAECRRVANRRIKAELGVRLRYPTYREGLAGLLAAGN